MKRKAPVIIGARSSSRERERRTSYRCFLERFCQFCWLDCSLRSLETTLPVLLALLLLILALPPFRRATRSVCRGPCASGPRGDGGKPGRRHSSRQQRQREVMFGMEPWTTEHLDQAITACTSFDLLHRGRLGQTAHCADRFVTSSFLLHRRSVPAWGRGSCPTLGGSWRISTRRFSRTNFQLPSIMHHQPSSIADRNSAAPIF